MSAEPPSSFLSAALPAARFDFSGKVVLVTGGGSGIGAGIALRFAEAGADVAVCSLTSEGDTPAQIERAGGRCLSLLADLSDPAQVEGVFDRICSAWRVPDVLINNAGIYPSTDLLSMSMEEWRRTLDVNLTGVFLCTQAAARRMIAAGKGGAVVNIASIEALSPARGHSHYAAAKAGVVMFGRAAALELGAHGIRVNTVSPGLIDRGGLPNTWPDGYRRYTQRAPLARVGAPGDVADACLFLSSDAARWISGANLVVDGGMLSSPGY